MKAEKVLLMRQVRITLIPVPRQLSADCGMAIRFPVELLDEVQQVLSEVKLKAVELWLLQNGQFERLN